jgi:pimeloyl-ACP methyl ester carboxylesterase
MLTSAPAVSWADPGAVADSMASRLAKQRLDRHASDHQHAMEETPQALLGGLDPKLIETHNVKRAHKIAYLTVGKASDPCVMVPPGGGATKEENLFWARELATLGPFYVVMYDLRGTGESEPRDRWCTAFPSSTSPVREMKRVVGMPERQTKTEKDKTGGALGSIVQKNEPAPLDPSISNQLHDFDAYAEDAFSVLDELGIRQAHFVGLSQGGTLARLAATLHPERVLSVVSCSSAASKRGLVMASFSENAEEFYDELKAAKLYGEDGRPPWCEAGSRRATRDEYVTWRCALLEIIVPGFDKPVYEEMAGRSWDAGYMDDAECAIAALAYEAWERQGKGVRHLEALRCNTTIPIMFVHGRKDPVIHFEESQTLFARTGNCVLEAHQFGHNFGPPRHQTALLGRMARFMLSSAAAARSGSPAAVPSPVGTDTYASGVSGELEARLSLDLTVSELWEAFCSVQTAADTSFALTRLLDKLGLSDLRGHGLRLFLALKPALEQANLKFVQRKLLNDLHTSLLRRQKLVAQLRASKLPESSATQAATAEETATRSANGGFAFDKILVCGAGPVGLRAACELALLGFHVTVVEKRPNFSRANILTFWDETMSDILALGAKSYFPSLTPTGTHKHLGTRQIQLCLLKTFLLFGGVAHYGMEICGMVPPGRSGPGGGSSSGKWLASFRPYERHRRMAQTEVSAKAAAEKEGVEESAAAAAAAMPATADHDGTAMEFQQAKDYGGKEMASIEAWDVDDSFLDGHAAAIASSASSATSATTQVGLAPVAFDAYVIAEGGWSDSTRRLGFNKSVEIFKPVFGLVANLKYDPTDLKQRNMRSQIHFVLGKEWPLHACPIQAEFVEYLKGETHFFALVVSKRNHHKDTTNTYLERLKPEERAAVPDEVVELLRRSSQQKGLLEMGVLRRGYASGMACLATDNVDIEKLHVMVRDITQEMGLPLSTEFFETNPIQLFDFSRRARCVEPVRLLRATSDGTAQPHVQSPADFLKTGGQAKGSAEDGVVSALALPVGDALQEPIWTQGLGINRGFHTAMNQAHACLLAREKGLEAAVYESCVVHEAVGKMRWGVGHSGLAGSGSGSIGLKPFKEWTTDPRSRLPIK